MSTWMRHELELLKSKNRFRELRHIVSDNSSQPYISVNGKKCIDFSSNDYLGLRNHPEMVAAASQAALKYGSGAGSSRLVSGNTSLYEELEAELKAFKGVPSVVVAASGYALNVSIIPTLVKEGDAVIFDRLSHASLVDGIRLSRARPFVYSHLDMNHLEKLLKRAKNYRRRLIITDSIFSMDGDRAPLPEIAALAQTYGAETLVDEAHATGVFGKAGKGLVEETGVQQQIDYIIGTFSKALGSLGGFFASRHTEAAPFIVNFARGVIFSTALPPPVLAASIKGIELCRVANEQRAKLFSLMNHFDASLSPIIPFRIGDDAKCIEISASLMESGFFVPAIRYPAVEKGKAMLRISLSANHSEEMVANLISLLG